MSRMGLTTRYVRRIEKYPTGTARVSFDAQGQPQFAIGRPAAYDFPQLSENDLAELQSQSPDWIYFGTLQQMSSAARKLTTQLLRSEIKAHRFYDVNLRPNCYESSLVKECLERATMVKLNDTEVEKITEMIGEPHASFEDFCRSYSAKFDWEAVCVTRGAKGCVLLIGDEYVEADGYPVTVADTVGAGDAFAAAFVHGFGKGWPALRIADFANRAGALVASHPGAIPSWTIAEAEALTHAR
jgi:fructokinase